MIVGNAYTILKRLVDITAPYLGDDFLTTSVAVVGQLFKADMVFVTRLLDHPPTRGRVLAAWQDGGLRDSFEFDLVGTPCEMVFDGAPVVIPGDVCRNFAAEKETTFESYVGIPLWGPSGEMIGHYAIISSQRIATPAEGEVLREIAQICAHRFEAEAWRLLIEAEKEAAFRQLQQLNARLEQEAITDFLTKLYNRRYFSRRCGEACARMRRGGERFALILFDVDHFKAVNDSYGHDAGDEVLASVAEVLRRMTRDNLEIVGRVGGEEFAVLCLGNPDAAAAGLIAERLRQAVAAQVIEARAGRLTVTVSAGFARSELSDESWESVYARADRALYRAKETGRNRVCAADDTT
ncbi:MAG TPA: GGDEF domain-containing protein [Accumulibacter sp.]|uniref:GGDEF domain-containing protein n=1 Tax=Accumulibacter sp. TaxID=2053492 RepID=UPI002BA71CE4|nr:GGDEF domain-containing protein [Accumulibacter sp.]HMX68829.1 GGDEF domain-containing protein [Accumulibacter sp.]HNC26684.1 GGDEF domain-containing protein [Accumulibacter sp.]HNI51394.1 GGDEF domain-containing protein [Accumulibacter sp.]HNN83088.1 GGDEF domain-containing protein [Accumulibacter sp.]